MSAIPPLPTPTNDVIGPSDLTSAGGDQGHGDAREVTSVQAKSPERRAVPRGITHVEAPANDHGPAVTSVEAKSPEADVEACLEVDANSGSTPANLPVENEYAHYALDTSAENEDESEPEPDEAPVAQTFRERRMGPLEPAADAAVIVERLWQRIGQDAPSPSPSFPAILEDVADIAGSVVMAEVANAGIPAISEDAEEAPDTSWLLGHVEAQLNAMDRFVARRLAAPFGARNGLPSLEKAQAALTAPDLSEDALKRAVADLSRAFGQRFLALLRTVRRDGTRIRADLAQELSSLGGRAAYLDRLDAALRRATAHEMAARDAMLGELVSAAASAAMTSDIKDEAPDPLLVERWYRRGFVRSLRADIDGLVRAFAAEERALLMHLANAALPAAGEAA